MKWLFLMISDEAFMIFNGNKERKVLCLDVGNTGENMQKLSQVGKTVILS
jgi:hypothetical protein